MKKIKSQFRLIIQIMFTAITNLNIKGFFSGQIYRGKTKFVCVPGLNCYSCPGALGSCPIGSFQAVVNSNQYKFSFYIIGALTSIGATTGRLTCGYLCPFGLFQDLIHKIPLFKKIKNLPFEKYLRKIKYIILIVFVILLPIFVINIGGVGNPYFCKYICPSGTLMAGIPLVLRDRQLYESIGKLFYLKLGILISITILSVKTYRPFCKYLCPLGAIYGGFNKVSFYKFNINEKCIKCNKCQDVCKLDIKTFENPNSSECIRCGDCIEICPVKAIETPFRKQD